MKLFEFIFNETLIRTVITIILLFVIYFILKIILDNILEHQRNKANIDIKKFNTLRILFINLIKYFLIVVGILVILNALGFKVSNIIAGLGIFSAVLALSLQDSLKDFFAGIFIILENQFSIGDIVKIGTFKGEVIFLGFKSTRIKSYTGEVKIISNRNITEVINYSKEYTKNLINITVNHEHDINKMYKVLDEICKSLDKKIKNIEGNIEFLGVENITSDNIVYRISFKTKYLDATSVQRNILKELEILLDESDVNVPHPQLEVCYGD